MLFRRCVKENEKEKEDILNHFREKAKSEKIMEMI